jgi:hypothetical protein
MANAGGLETVPDAPIQASTLDPAEIATADLPVTQSGIPEPLVPPAEQLNVITQDLANQGIEAPTESIKAATEFTNEAVADGNLSPNDIAEVAKTEAIAAGASPDAAQAITDDAMEAAGFTRIQMEDGEIVYGRVTWNGAKKVTELLRDTDGNGQWGNAGDEIHELSELGTKGSNFYTANTRQGVLTKDILGTNRVPTQVATGAPAESAGSLAGDTGQGFVQQPDVAQVPQQTTLPQQPDTNIINPPIPPVDQNVSQIASSIKPPTEIPQPAGTTLDATGKLFNAQGYEDTSTMGFSIAKGNPGSIATAKQMLLSSDQQSAGIAANNIASGLKQATGASNVTMSGGGGQDYTFIVDGKPIGSQQALDLLSRGA